MRLEQKSRISWTDVTWNPWRGCDKVSQACKYCYMFRYYEKKGINPKSIVKQMQVFNSPLQRQDGVKIFTCSMSDFFHKEADNWRDDAWDIIKRTPQHTYLILTKRPERIKKCLPENWSLENYGNVWLGVTVESQSEVSRVHFLEDISCNVKWVSFEPLLSDIQLQKKELDIINWAVIGGESGYRNQVRKTELCWFNSLMFQIIGYGIPLFFKQFGSSYHYSEFKLKDWHGEAYCENYPKRYRVRQYPIYNHGEEEIMNFKLLKNAS